MNIITDIEKLFQTTNTPAKFILYDQTALDNDESNIVAIPFTALGNEFNEIRESDIANQPLENGTFRSSDQNFKPLVLNIQAFYQPPPLTKEAYLNDMDIVKQLVNKYYENDHLIAINQHYPICHVYSNMKIIKAQNKNTPETRGRLYYELTLQQIVPFQVQYSTPSSQTANDPINSGVINK